MQKQNFAVHLWTKTKQLAPSFFFLVTHTRWICELVLLEESINTLRMDFNDRFLALRDLKRRLIDSIARDTERIRVLNRSLGVEEEMTVPARLTLLLDILW